MDISTTITAIICAGFFLWLYIKSKNKSRFGINLKAVYCPLCNTKQPRIRKPLNSRQAMFGGTTCPKCRTELDKYGTVIS